MARRKESAGAAVAPGAAAAANGTADRAANGTADRAADRAANGTADRAPDRAPDRASDSAADRAPNRAAVNRQAARGINSGAIHLLRGVRRVDRLSGVTPARLSALSVLVFGGPRALGRLAADEDVAGPTMTRIVDGLVGLGLARREAHPSNARSVMVSATSAGERLMRTAADRRIDLLIRAMADLDDDERALLHRAAPLLDRLADALWRLPVDAPGTRRASSTPSAPSGRGARETGQFD